VCIVRKDLVRDRINVFPIIILYKVELGQVRRLEGRSVDRVRAVLLQPWQDVGEVENGAVRGAYGVLEGL